MWSDQAKWVWSRKFLFLAFWHFLLGYYLSFILIKNPWRLSNWFLRNSILSDCKNNKKQRKILLCLAISLNWYLRVPTHFAWLHHICACMKHQCDATHACWGVCICAKEWWLLVYKLSCVYQHDLVTCTLHLILHLTKVNRLRLNFQYFIRTSNPSSSCCSLVVALVLFAILLFLCYTRNNN